MESAFAGEEPQPVTQAARAVSAASDRATGFVNFFIILLRSRKLHRAAGGSYEIVLGLISVPCGRYIACAKGLLCRFCAAVILCFQNFLEFIHECLNILELTVDRREPHVGDRIKVLEAAHDKLADLAARNFLLLAGVNLRLDLVNQLLDLVNADGSLVACAQDAALNLRAVIWLAVIVLFDDNKWNGLNLLVCRETLPAGIADSAAADGCIPVCRARVNDTCVFLSAIRTFHGCTSCRVPRPVVSSRKTPEHAPRFKSS